jgi:hypothetical protein
VELELLLDPLEDRPVWLVQTHPHELAVARQSTADLIDRKVRDSPPVDIGGAIDDWCGGRRIDRVGINHREAQT